MHDSIAMRGKPETMLLPLLARSGLVSTLLIIAAVFTRSNATRTAAAQDHRNTTSSAASCRVAVCFSGHIRSLVHSAVHKSIRRNLIEAIEADGCDVDVFAYATATDTLTRIKQVSPPQRARTRLAFEVVPRTPSVQFLQVLTYSSVRFSLQCRLNSAYCRYSAGGIAWHLARLDPARHATLGSSSL